MTLKPHETLLNGKYLVERVLGRGGFGFVYLARDTIIGRPVAIKEMNPSLADDDQMVRRFLVEGRATLQLRHPHIVEVYDVFSDRGLYYLAMEYCPGGSLDERLAAGPLVISDALVIMDQVCAGLAHTHSRGIVHCDVKPANILFGGDGLAKVTDFGVAHVSSTAVARSWGTVSSFTAGTLYYMAPEQLDGVRDDPRVDVYALGAMLYRMITGGSYLDFHSEATISDQIHNALLIKQGAPLAPSQRVRNVPGWLDRVILQTLSKDPAARHADAGALRTALHPVAAAAPRVSATPSTPPTVVLSTKARPPSAARPASRGTPAWMWVMAGSLGVLILVVVALAVTLSNNTVSDAGPAEGGGTIVPTATLRVIVMATETLARPQLTVTWTPSPTIAQPTKPAGTTAAVQVTPTGASPTVTPKPATLTPKPPTLEPPSSPVPPTATRPPPTLTPVNLPVPVLLSPADGVSVSGETTFAWSWSGPELATDQAFEVRIWKDGQPVHYGATGLVRTTPATFDVAGAYAVTQGGSGNYFWTVAVVSVPYKPTGPEAPPRALRIELSDGGSGGGTPPTPTRPP